MAMSPKATFAAGAAIALALLAFFMFVEMSQRQTVNAMFVVLGIAAAFWFWKKPWK